MEAYLDAAYDNAIDAHVGIVQLVEVHYVLTRVIDEESVGEFINYLSSIGIKTVRVTTVGDSLPPRNSR